MWKGSIKEIIFLLVEEQKSHLSSAHSEKKRMLNLQVELDFFGIY